MAGNEHYENEARARKVASLTKAVDWAARTQSADPEAMTEAMLNALAGRYGPDDAGTTWAGVLCLAKELTGVNHGDPSLQVQEQVIGRLFCKLAQDAYLASRTDEQVFAGLAVVQS